MRGIFLLGFFLFVLGCSQQPEIQNDLESVVAAVNAKCPVMIDSETLFEGVDLAGDTLSYKFTLINALASATDTSGFRVAMWPGILSTIRVSDEMKPIRDQKLYIRYSYRDKYHTPLSDLMIRPAHYLEAAP